MAYYSTHSISQFLSNYEKQRIRFLLAHPVLMGSVFLQFFCVLPSCVPLNYIAKLYNYKVCI